MTSTNIRQNLSTPVAEGGSSLLSFTLTDENGAPVTLAQLGTLRWWHYNESTSLIVNSRTNVDIKNLNGGTVHATSGACTLALTPADNVLSDQTSDSEWLVAFIKGTYNGGAGVVEKEIAYRVVALPFSP